MKNWIKLGLILILAVAIIIPGCAKEAPAPAPAPTPAPAPAPKPAPAPAPKPKDDAAAFYKGKVITFVVPLSPGGGYDTYSRLLAPYLEKYTGASTVIVRNMPGGGSLLGTNYVYNTAKHDGLTVCIIQGHAMAANKLLDIPEAKFDLAKFGWLGRVAWDIPAFTVGGKSPYMSLDDVRALKELKLGATGRYSVVGLRTVMAAEALGLANAKLVVGYPGSTQVMLGVVTGEVDADIHSIESAIKLIKAGDLRALATVNHERYPDLPDVPTVFEVGIPTKEGEEWMSWWIGVEQVGRGIVTTPDVPEARLKLLQDAFLKSCQDKEFLARAKKAGRSIMLLSGEEALKLAQKSMALSKEKIEEFKGFVEKY